ncbi:MAG: lipase family protein [Planctomycetota bacterium]
MEFSNTWKSLMKPGEDQHYFTLANKTPFQIQREYSPVNAWWLMELCRLSYKNNRAKRREILDTVDLREIEFFNNEGTQCSIIEPLDPKTPKFGIIVFRGTDEFKDWLANLDSIPVEWFPGYSEKGNAHKGFADALDYVWNESVDDKLWLHVKDYLTQAKHPFFYTGHSLGGALATLAASLIPPEAAYTFGSPRVGNKAFKENLKGINIFRVANHSDVVPTVPPSTRLFSFDHVGEFYYFTKKSELWINPSEEQHKKEEPLFEEVLAHIKSFQNWFHPMAFLADHAPINYVAHLQNQLEPPKP